MANDFIKLTGAWKNKEGKPWATGKIKVQALREALAILGESGCEEATVFVFNNDKRGNDRAPDFNISLAPSKQQAPSERGYRSFDDPFGGTAQSKLPVPDDDGIEF